MSGNSAPPRPGLAALFGRFLRFGFLAWGGPVAQIAMIKRELVEEEHWLSADRFNRLLAVYQLLPGPEAHELCVHLGMMRRGRLGGVVAGLGFMLPGLLLMLLLAALYQRLDFGQPMIAAAFAGIQVAVVALIVRAVHRIGRHMLADASLWAIAIGSGLATAAGVSFWIVLPVAGLAYAALRSGRKALALLVLLTGLMLAALTLSTGAPSPAAIGNGGTAGSATVTGLFALGLKAGLLTFGGAYTAIPFVRTDAVGRGWLSDGQFLDGLALGGVIPAPLIIFATFVGYLAGGLAGALAITAGIFLPAFAFGLVFYDRLERIVEEPRLHDLLAGVAAGVVGLIAVTALQLCGNVAGATSAPWWALLLFAVTLALFYRWQAKASVPLIMAGAALYGLITL